MPNVSFIYNNNNIKLEANSTKDIFGKIINFLYENGYSFSGNLHKATTRKLLNLEEYRNLIATTSYSDRNFYSIPGENKFIISNYNSYIIEKFIIDMLKNFKVENIKTNGFTGKKISDESIQKFSEFDGDESIVNFSEFGKERMVSENPFKQAVCVLGESGAGKSYTIENILENEGHEYEFIIPTSATTNLLAQFSPSKSKYVASRLGRMLINASNNTDTLYTAIFDEMHKSSIIEMINDELLQAISVRRNRYRFISLDQDTAELYDDSGLETERGNIKIPDNFGFIFISSKPRVISNNSDFFNRVDLVVLTKEDWDLKTTKELLDKKLSEEEKSKFTSTRND